MNPMSRVRSFAKHWLPVIGLMALIFAASGDRLSFERSSRFIGPLARWLFPDLTSQQVHLIIVSVRKGAHVGEYALLSALVWRALRGSLGQTTAPWSWAHAGGTVSLVTIYALADEFHQTFIPGRYGSLSDILLNIIGCLTGFAVFYFLKWRTTLKNSGSGIGRTSVRHKRRSPWATSE